MSRMKAPNMDIASLFIRVQQEKDAAWKAHIGKKDIAALAHADRLGEAATELVRLLADEKFKVDNQENSNGKQG